MDERRKDSRRRLRHQLMVLHPASGQLLGYLRNITKNGLRLIGAAPIKPGEMLSCKILLPERLGGATHILVEAQCVWSQKDQLSGFHESGFRIVKTPQDAISIIARLIEEFETPG